MYSKHAVAHTISPRRFALHAVITTLTHCVLSPTGEEGLLQQLCYMAAGIKQLTVTPDGGNFALGNGDTSLEFPPGTVEKKTFVRYAIILNGPFLLPAGSKLGSVVVYINMNGSTLAKPVILSLSHWCARKGGDDKDTLLFLRASHTLEEGQQKFIFEVVEEGADLTSHPNVGILSIREPHCLYCVKIGEEETARYSAITFSRCIPTEDILLFRIQFICASVEWNEVLHMYSRLAVKSVI